MFVHRHSDTLSEAVAASPLSSYLSASTRHFFVIAHFSTSRYASNNIIENEGASKLGESIAKLTNLSSLDINL